MDLKELKERKKKLKLTTDELAFLSGLPYGTVSKIFTGETSSPRYQTMERLEAALLKAEQSHRLRAYYEAMARYFAEHPEAEGDQLAFEKIYRKENHLSDDPIPFAVPVAEWTGTAPEEGNTALQMRGRLTVEDYLKLATDHDTQLMDGHLIYSQAPSFEHQLLVEGLGDSIKAFIRGGGGPCKVYSSGINVQLDEEDDSLLIPDVIVICQEQKIREYGIQGAPDWVIEVTSPSSRRLDYKDKMYKYMKYGVREYWVVDLQKRIVATYINELPMITGLYQFADEIPVSIYDGEMTICIKDILAEA